MGGAKQQIEGDHSGFYSGKNLNICRSHFRDNEITYMDMEIAILSYYLK